jgi:hypothetical protein
MIVAIEAIGRSLPRWKTFQPRAVYQENVGPAVVVVIENGDAVSRGFNDVFLGIDPAKNIGGRESCLGGDVDEIDDLRGRRWGSFCRLSAEIPCEKASACQHEHAEGFEREKLRSHQVS